MTITVIFPVPDIAVLVLWLDMNANVKIEVMTVTLTLAEYGGELQLVHALSGTRPPPHEDLSHDV